MIRKLIGLGLVAATARADDAITVTCNKDNTIDVTVAYDMKAEVLEFKYGTCTKDSSRANFTQNAKFGWAFSLDVTSCGMDNKLRNLEYNQTASMRVGRKSGGSELTLATFSIDSYCTYTSSYKVKFNYGDVAAESHTFKSDAGLINLTFALKSYAKNYSKELTHSKQAGDMIHLGLSITNTKFNHASDIATSTEGKVFAPKSCLVVDGHSQKYTLFDHSVDSCGNKDVDFAISFDQASNMWRFSHTLFLIGNHRSSKLDLECDVVVCDKKKAAECDAVVKACTTPVDGTIAWEAYGNCTKKCYNGKPDTMGTKTRTGVCTPPTFFGKACGALSQTINCTDTKRCPINGGWGNWTAYSACSKKCGGDASTKHTKTRKCDNPTAKHGGTPCDGNTTMTKTCGQDACPVDGGWGNWTAYSSCSKNCGGDMNTVQTRTRKCDNPTPLHGGKKCPSSGGSSFKLCGQDPCPINGGWGNWTAYSSCSKKCGGDMNTVQTKTRKCDNPTPLHGGTKCPSSGGSSFKLCGQDPCPVNGGWGNWTEYAACSKQCGGDANTTHAKTRLCDNPTPLHGGTKCNGLDIESKTCGQWKCINGAYTATIWGACSASCKSNQTSTMPMQTGSRTCNNPSPGPGGQSCTAQGLGAATITRECNTDNC